MKEIESRDGTAGAVGDAQSPLSDVVRGNEKQIEETLQYLVKNQETLDSTQAELLRALQAADPQAPTAVDQLGGVDPIHKLQRMSLSEMTRAYDILLSILKQREALVKRRLKECLEHFGKEDRVVHASHDFEREQEQMPDILQQLYRNKTDGIDTYLSVNEQIENLHMLKTMPSELKVYQFLVGNAPYADARTFSDSQLAHARAPGHEAKRQLAYPDDEATRSDLLIDGGIPMPFKKEEKAAIQKQAQRARDELETPFDELYQKERKLVQDIVKAE